MEKFYPLTNTSINCVITGCNDTAKARGLCSKHHQRWYRTGSVELVQEEKKPPCIIKDCLRLSIGKHSYCGYHKNRIAGGFNPIPRNVITHCTIEFCNRPHRARGLCGHHYTKLVFNKKKTPD